MVEGHICKGGKYRPYPSLLCSMCLPGEAIEVATKKVADDSWFWTDKWQKMEREADEDLAAGRYDDFESWDEFIKALDSASDEALLNFERQLDSRSLGLDNSARG